MAKDQIYHYDTVRGVPTPGTEFAQLSEHLVKARENCLMLGHLAKEDGDELLGKGWHGVAELLFIMNQNVSRLAQKGMHK